MFLTQEKDIASRTLPLLLIDDDRSLAVLLTDYCTPEGFSIISAATGEEGIRLAREHYFNLIILDVMLPGIDGFEVLRRLRHVVKTPVLMLTTRSASEDRIHGLQIGADDYLPKPFIPAELLARIRSILRRTNPSSSPVQLRQGDVHLDEMLRSVSVNGQNVNLTGAEFHLLTLLLSQPGLALSREELILRIFNREVDAFDRSIDNLVNNIRKKLGSHSSGVDRIRSIRNVGYCYVLANEEQITQ